MFSGGQAVHRLCLVLRSPFAAVPDRNVAFCFFNLVCFSACGVFLWHAVDVDRACSFMVCNSPVRRVGHRSFFAGSDFVAPDPQSLITIQVRVFADFVVFELTGGQGNECACPRVTGTSRETTGAPTAVELSNAQGRQNPRQRCEGGDSRKTRYPKLNMNWYAQQTRGPRMFPFSARELQRDSTLRAARLQACSSPVFQLRGNWPLVWKVAEFRDHATGTDRDRTGTR